MKTAHKEDKITMIAYFGLQEQEHFRECVADGFMTEEERREETKHLKEIVEKGIAKILSKRH